MGPIGMLVIQRTLNKGRRPALFTGVGAALSDLTYSLLTGLGLSFITDFIIAKELLLQIIGSVVLIAFALYRGHADVLLYPQVEREERVHVCPHAPQQAATTRR